MLSLFETASMLFQTGDAEGAVTCYKQILASDSQNIRALHALCVISFQRQDVLSALEYLQLVFDIQYDYETAWITLAKIQRNLGLYTAARISCQKAIDNGGNSSELLCFLGGICRELNLFHEAEQYLNQALELFCLDYRVHYEYGCLHQKNKRHSEALKCFAKALELKQDYGDAYARQSLSFYTQGRIRESNESLKQCLKIKPKSTVAWSLLAFSLNYEPGIKMFEVLEASCEWARLSKQALAVGRNRSDNKPEPDRPLKIGFVSPDFRRHPVGYFVQSFMMLHDRDNFEVYCYSDVQSEDEITLSLIEAVEKWRRVHGIKDDKLAEMIRRDRIDILVDLAGHTKDNRLNVFVLKPAPVQVTWAGYVGTTGLDTIDYLISDRYQSPEGSEEYTVEQIVRMPDDYICFMPPEHSPEVVPLPALVNGFITFGCFNNLAKLSDDAIFLWAKILRKLPHSRLFIKNPSFSDLGLVDRYLAMFEAHGITADRITTEGQSPPEEMLASYSRIDIQLDTLPYSGGLTTLESLWMGVPVITLPGALFSSRHSLTHLMNVGLPECVATSKEDYVDIACNLASDVKRLSEMRKSLRNMMAESPVCDGFRFAENLQDVFRQMWHGWCEMACQDQSDFCSEEDDGLNLGDHIAYNDAGNHYSDQGDIKTAIECYKRAIDIKPGYVEAYYNLGFVYRKMERLEEAVRMFKLVVCLAPDFVEAYPVFSETLRFLGRDDDAQSVDAKVGEIKKLNLSGN